MGVREKIRENAQKVVPPGETIQAVIPVQTVSPYWSIVSYWIIIFSNAYRNVIVTDRRILICSTGRLSTTQVNEIIRELPRQTKIGPAEGLWYKTDSLGETVFISRRYFKDIEAADTGAGA